MRAAFAIPITLLLIIRSYRRQSLTPVGILAAGLTAIVHSLHPSALPFTLLCAFFLLGTTATKVKHDVKATLTLSSSGSSGGEGPRTSIQVFANSGCASLLVLCHVWLYGANTTTAEGACFGEGEKSSGRTADLLLLGIMANYAAVTADTLSSELGILSKSKPVLITTLRTVPPGTNGGVTFAGLLAGIAGSAAISATSLVFLNFCNGANNPQRLQTFLVLTGLGTAGTLLDSLLGAILQASVVDRRSGKIVEGIGGAKVLTRPTPHHPSSQDRVATSAPSHEKKPSDSWKKGEESRVICSGRDLLDNNQINFLMAGIMSMSGILTGNLLWS